MIFPVISRHMVGQNATLQQIIPVFESTTFLEEPQLLILHPLAPETSRLLPRRDRSSGPPLKRKISNLKKWSSHAPTETPDSPHSHEGAKGSQRSTLATTYPLTPRGVLEASDGPKESHPTMKPPDLSPPSPERGLVGEIRQL